MKKKYYYVYQITNLINEKIYVGVHRTYDLNDGYMGSGTYLHRAYKKYGIENFKKEILEFCNSLEESLKREKEIVNLDFIKRKDTYNVVIGGGKGYPLTAVSNGGKTNYINKTGIFSDEAQKNLKSYRVSEKNLENLRRMSETASSEESIEKRVETFKRIEHQQGRKNSMYGKKWITNGIDNTIIKKEESIPDGWRKGRSNVFSDEQKEKFSNDIKSRESKIKGLIWINNGKINKRIPKESSIPTGFVKGNLKNKNKERL